MAVQRQAGAFEADQVHQVVAPGRGPQGGRHLPRVDLLDQGRVPQRAQASPASPPRRSPAHERARRHCCRGGSCERAAFRRETALMHRILRRPAGRGFRAVVGRRADPQETETVGVVMRIEQRGDRSDAAAGSSDDTPNTTSASMPCCATAAGTFKRSAMPCFSASSKSTIQRMPSSTASWSSARNPCRSGRDPPPARDRGAPSAWQPAHRASSRWRSSVAAWRARAVHAASHRRSCGIGAAASPGSTGNGLSGGIGAAGQSRNWSDSARERSMPHAARRSVRELLPAETLARFVVAGAPGRCQKCRPQCTSSRDSAGSCVSTWIWSG